MPSPIGHGLAAIAVGWVIAPASGTSSHKSPTRGGSPTTGNSRQTIVARAPARATWLALLAEAVNLAALGAAPDLDLLIGRHSRETHSVGAAVLVATIAVFCRWPLANGLRRWPKSHLWIVVFAAWLSHPLLDCLAPDHAPPIGVMLFWPFSHAHFLSGWEIFDPISRDWSSPDFFRHNLTAMLKEVAMVGPIVALAGWRRMRRLRSAA